LNRPLRVDLIDLHVLSLVESPKSVVVSLFGRHSLRDIQAVVLSVAAWTVRDLCHERSLLYVEARRSALGGRMVHVCTKATAFANST
jgi:hypothetical protein